MQRVFVLDTHKKPLNPCRPKRARILLRAGKAAVYRRFPFTIILKRVVEPDPHPLRLKLDPGSKKTGIAMVNDQSGEVVFAAELEHRGQKIKSDLDARRALRRSRRNRKTRYRKPRFLNRTRKSGWLSPSVQSRVENILTWVKRLARFAPVTAISQELVKFNMQQMQNPEIAGVEYQQGTLAGYEVREYLLEKWGHACAYCGKKDVPLEIEHLMPKSRGGSNRVSNLTLACRPCNEQKGRQTAEEFGYPQLRRQATMPLKDAAVVNTTRWALFECLKASGLPMEVGSGGLTKFNRTERDLAKGHWQDAACVGKSTPTVLKTEGVKPLAVKATGHGSRQMCRVNKFGFPRSAAKTRQKVIHGFKTGDIARLIQPTGKYTGTHEGRVSVRERGDFDIQTVFQGKKVKITSSWKHFVNLHKGDGYDYVAAA